MRYLLYIIAILLLMQQASYAKTPKHLHKQGGNTALKKVLLPKLEISVYRRSYTPGERVSVNLNSYNVKTVKFRVYRMDMNKIVINSRVMDDFAKVIKNLDLNTLSKTNTFQYRIKTVYTDTWLSNEVRTPKMPTGTYLIVGTSGTAIAKTWFTVTHVALLAKRSRQELLVYAADAISGKPAGQLGLACINTKGARITGSTDNDGVMRIPYPIDKNNGNVWVTSTSSDEPAFILSGTVAAPPAYTVYTYTDRPIYRPGQQVEIKSTIREHIETDAPGGFSYRTYANKPAIIEIRDATDALISHKRVTTNEYGSITTNVSLANETPLGNWQIIIIINDFHSYTNFQVQAYRKPEYNVTTTIPKPHYTGGSEIPVTINAKYYSGQPVPNAKVRYRISFSSGEPAYTGEGSTDNKGIFNLTVKTKNLSIDRTFSFNATIIPLSRRQVETSAYCQVTAGDYNISLSPDYYQYKVKQTAYVTVKTHDYDYKPVSAKVKIEFVETKEDNQHRQYNETTTQEVVTDKDGEAKAHFLIKRTGYITVNATSYDQHDNKITTSTSLYTPEKFTPPAQPVAYWPILEIKADKQSYQLGDKAIIRLRTDLIERPGQKLTRQQRKQQPPKPKEMWALVSVEGERLYQHFVLNIDKADSTFTVPISDRYFPNADISLVIVQGMHIYEQQIRVDVPRADHKLNITVSSDKAHYQPGETAVYTISARDFAGHPTPAEVSLGIVDSSIYEIAPDNTTPIDKAFYGEQDIRVQTDFSFAAIYSGGAYQHVPPPMLPAMPPNNPNIRIRRNFVDTAYWAPTVVTGNDGVAKCTVTIPDNLTAWRATVRGITQKTQVGQNQNEVKSSMPLMVRLATPRFYVAGDDTTISAVIHNDTNTAKTISLKVDTVGMKLSGTPTDTVTVDAQGEKRIEWRAYIAEMNNASIGDKGSATIRVVADGGDGASDAVESTLPVLPDGVKMVEGKPDTLITDSDQSSIDLTKLPAGAVVKVSLAPSIGSAMLQSLDYLTEYPYGCAEQTVSALLPDVYVQRTLQRLHIKKTLKADPNKLVNLGLQRLYQYQHQDGGWNWWEFDQSTGDMTSYILWALCQARDAGYTVDSQRIVRGAASLERFLKDEKDDSTRADWLLALACAKPDDAAAPLLDLYEHRSRLDLYGQASLCIALSQAGGKLSANASTVADEIEKQISEQPNNGSRFSYWKIDTNGYTWQDDPVFVNARALRAVIYTHPNSKVIEPVVRWLMAQRYDNAWSSTRTTAEVVFALTQYMERSNELHPNCKAMVSLDNDTVKSLAFDSSNVFNDPATFTLEPSRLKGHKQLTITRSGNGVVYSNISISYLIPSHLAKVTDHGIKIIRKYHYWTPDPSQIQPVHCGDVIDTEISLQADVAYPYAMIVEPIPSGCEVTPEYEDNGGWRAYNYTHREVRDDKIVYFFDELPQGETSISYQLRTELPVTSHIIPDTAELVYHPEFRGNSGPGTVKVAE